MHSDEILKFLDELEELIVEKDLKTFTSLLFYIAEKRNSIEVLK